MQTNTILLIILIVLVLVLLYKDIYKQENLDASSLSNEALQNIAKVYGDKDGNVTFNNVKITGKLDCSNNITTSGNLNVSGDSYFSGLVHFGGKGTDTWFPYSDGKNYIRGDVQVDGATTFNKFVNLVDLVHFGGHGTDTWMPYSDGKFYIRGPMQVDGDLSVRDNAYIQGQPAMREQQSYRHNHYGGHNDNDIFYYYPTT